MKHTIVCQCKYSVLVFTFVKCSLQLIAIYIVALYLCTYILILPSSLLQINILLVLFHTHRTVASSTDKHNDDEDYTKYQEPLLELTIA